MDQPHLVGFQCERYREPWSAVVQQMVREKLADNLGVEGTSAVGAWAATADLAGVAAWRIEGDLCHSILVAVQTGFSRHGIGGSLKDRVVTEARAAGAVAVVSHVHWENEAMIALNLRRGANIERVAGDSEYCRCIIPITP